MPKSRNRKNHSQKLIKYKENKKKEQELFKKKLMDNYIKMQEQAYAEQEAYTSIEEGIVPDIDIDELNNVENLNVTISEDILISEELVEEKAI